MMAVTTGFAACGKDSSSEESMRAELESLRAQIETQEDDESQVDEQETEDTQESETVNETEETQELRSWNVPFTVADGNNNLSIGQIAGDGTLYYTLAGVREYNSFQSSLEGTFYTSEIPQVPSGQVVVHPLIQIYNGSDEIQEYDDDDVVLYVDNVQVSRVDTSYPSCYWVDGLEELIYTDLDPAHSSVLVSAFNVDENWSSMTVFYGDASWTVTREEVLDDAYVYTNLFETNETFELTEPDSVVYSNPQYEVVFDGYEVYQEGLRYPFLLFEFTITNSTDSVLELTFPNPIRGYFEHRLLDNASTVIDVPVNGYNNICYSYNTNSLEIHPGMSSKVFASFQMIESTGVYECALETEEDGVIAYVYTQVE